MGTNITGYIEINSIKESDEDIWFEIIKIDVVAERNYEVFGNLFGVRSQAGVNALAASRGIPTGTSNSNSLICKSNTYVGHTWANWRELKLAKNLIYSNSEISGWNFIFESMEILSKKYGEENVRLVVAFDNYG
ncbi:MAG: hypothetical protein EOO53_03780 [Gammaproteobacteria bacterium]|nr:MAG: hypothetical protein EOO53_03780 [Gammaproteobacteria bacterium]